MVDGKAGATPKAKTGLAGDPRRCHMRVAGPAIRKIEGVARS
jgi:hypothetical protein